MSAPQKRWVTIAELVETICLGSNPEKIWDAINEGTIPFELVPPDYDRMGIPMWFGGEDDEPNNDRQGPFVPIADFCEDHGISEAQFFQAVDEGIIPAPTLSEGILYIPSWDLDWTSARS